MEIENKYQKKYLKYKTKYENLKHGGSDFFKSFSDEVKSFSDEEELFCSKTKKNYILSKKNIEKAENIAFKKFNVKEKLDNNLGEGLLNKLLNTFTYDLAEHKTYFDTNEPWMKDSYVVGFREGGYSMEAIIEQPVFYSPEKNFFWQFEPEYNLAKGRWFNNVPKSKLKENRNVVDEFPLDNVRVHLFEWYSGIYEVSEVLNKVNDAIDSSIMSTLDGIENAGSSLGVHEEQIGVYKGAGKTLNDLLPNSNLVNPPQIGGSEKI